MIFVIFLQIFLCNEMKFFLTFWPKRIWPWPEVSSAKMRLTVYVIIYILNCIRKIVFIMIISCKYDICNYPQRIIMYIPMSCSLNKLPFIMIIFICAWIYDIIFIYSKYIHIYCWIEQIQQSVINWVCKKVGFVHLFCQ